MNAPRHIAVAGNPLTYAMRPEQILAQMMTLGAGAGTAGQSPLAPTPAAPAPIVPQRGGQQDRTRQPTQRAGFRLSPGRQGLLTAASMLAPGPIGMGLGAMNAGLGAVAELQKLDAVSQITGVPNSFMDGVGAFAKGATGWGDTLSIGGYGAGGAGQGGKAGLRNATDPGVAGPARAQAHRQSENYASTGSIFGGATAADLIAGLDRVRRDRDNGRDRSQRAGDGGIGDTGRGGADRGSLGPDRDREYGGPR